MQRRLTKLERATLPGRYLAGESSEDIAKSFGVSGVAILNHLKKMGIQRREPSLARREYPLWDGAFSTLSPEASYWLGFLMADGCVHDDSKVTLGLARCDLRHLEKFRAYLRTSARPIQYVPQSRSYVLKIHSRQIVQDLARYGITPRKSLTAQARNGIDCEPAFWLGVLDGDGCIGFSKNQIRVRFYGTPRLMGQLVDFLVSHQIRGRGQKLRLSVSKQGQLGCVSLEGIRARNLLGVLYGTSPVWLERKKAKAQLLGGLIPPVPRT
jgi:hypothetical protein